MWEKIKKFFKIYKIEDLDFSQTAQIRFVQNYGEEYFVQFWHPLHLEWWFLPSSGEDFKGSILYYGKHPEIRKMRKKRCSFQDIEAIRTQFKTLKDVNDYLETLVKRTKARESNTFVPKIIQ